MNAVNQRGHNAQCATRMKQGISAALLAAAFCSPIVSAAPSATTTSEQSGAKWAEIEAIVNDELQRIVDKQPRIEGQSKLVKVRAKLDQAQRTLTINLSSGYIPKHNGAEFEDLQTELTNAALELIEPAITVRTIDFLFDGRTVTSYFPEDAPPPRQQKKSNTP